MTREQVRVMLKTTIEQAQEALSALSIRDKKSFAMAIVRLEVVTGPLGDITKMPEE